MLIRLTDTEGGAGPSILYELGTVVTHKIYGYRGVIVSVDGNCMAGESWYKSNKTQPSRKQPWYHLLVHNSGGLSTYVAQSNLIEDVTGQPVKHPRITYYFEIFEAGRYKLKYNADSTGCSV